MINFLGQEVDENGSPIAPAPVASAPYVGPTSDPFLNFTSQGTNRNALYGAYMDMPAITTQTLNMFGQPIVDETGNSAQTSTAGPFSFENHLGIPDLSQWSGQQLGDSGDFKGPVSLQSATEAQAILKQFFPNVSQEQLDRAAYAAQQSGTRYINGLNGDPINDTSPYYYGYGPLPLVIGVAKELGGVPPALESYINSNWTTSTDKYANLRQQAKAAADAASTSDALGIAGGIAGVLGPAVFGGFGGFDALNSALNGGTTGSAAGGNMGLWDSITSGLSDFGSSLSDWFGGSSGLPEALGEAGGYNFTSSEALGQLPQLLGEAGGYGTSGGSSTSWLSDLYKAATSNPTSTAGQILKSITGSSNAADWAKLLGSALSSGVGAYAANQQSNDLQDMAKRYEGYGAPYRQKLSDLYANPDSFLQSNEVQKPVQMGTDNLMRSLSMQGNPFGSGNALQQGQSYASDQLFSRLGQEKDRLAGFGGLSAYNQAAPAATSNAINSQANAWNAAGAGVNNIFSPPQTPAQQAAEWMKVMGG